MTNEFARIFFAGERNIDETLEKTQKAARICAAIAGENARAGVKVLSDGAALVGALWTARSPQEAVEAQTGYARRFYEDYASNTAKIGALWIDLWKEALPGFDAGAGSID